MSVVIACLKKVHPALGDSVNQTMFLSDSSRPAASQHMLERLGLSDAGERIAKGSVDEFKDAERGFAVRFNPIAEVFAELLVEYCQPVSVGCQGPSPAAVLPRTRPCPRRVWHASRLREGAAHSPESAVGGQFPSTQPVRRRVSRPRPSRCVAAQSRFPGFPLPGSKLKRVWLADSCRWFRRPFWAPSADCTGFLYSRQIGTVNLKPSTPACLAPCVPPPCAPRRVMLASSVAGSTNTEAE